jgi:hypothetical protein
MDYKNEQNNTKLTSRVLGITGVLRMRSVSIRGTRKTRGTVEKKNTLKNLHYRCPSSWFMSESKLVKPTATIALHAPSFWTKKQTKKN